MNTRLRIGLTLALVALLTSTILTGACAPKAPPNLTPVQTRINNTETAEQAVIALSQTAINLNTPNAQGRKVLSDGDTRLVRDFALAFDAWRTGYANGTTPFAQVNTILTTLNTSLSADAKSDTLKTVLAAVTSAVAAIPVN